MGSSRLQTFLEHYPGTQLSASIITRPMASSIALLRHPAVGNRQAVSQGSKCSQNGQPSGHVQDSADPDAACNAVIPQGRVPKDVGVKSAIGGVDVAVVGDSDNDQVPLGGRAAGREAAHDGEGGKQEEHVAELQGDG